MKKKVGIVIGGVSVEHEVSVITGLQAAAALDRSQYDPVPIYISKAGDWYTGEVLLDIEQYHDLTALLRQAIPVTLYKPLYEPPVLLEQQAPWWRRKRRFPVDVLLLALHGGEGEDGSFQGLCETYNLPYTSSGVLSAALAMDKVFSKQLCQQVGIPVVPFNSFRESEWAEHEDEWLDRIIAELGLPVIVKPARLGSSIGISRAETRETLESAIEEALRFDEKIIIEKAIYPLREINCSVLGHPDEAVVSVLEEPLPGEQTDLLTFEDKYQRGSKGGGKQASGMAALDRIIPAPLEASQEEQIRELALRIFKYFECYGVVRIDFLLKKDTGEVYFNELNTIPGSLSFYLWEPVGISFTELTHRLIQLALRRHQFKNRRVREYEPNLLAAGTWKGVKK